MTIRGFVRARIDRILARRGYALRRTRIEGTGWDEIVRRAGEGARGEGPIVLDIGAHEGGLSTMVFSHWPMARVFAFEPIPELCSALGMLAQRYPNLTVEPIALGEGNADGVEFNVHASNASSSLLPADAGYGGLYPEQARLSRKIAVAVRRLDDWAAENGLASDSIDLVKMDVQGFEDRVIAGGEATLRRTRYLVTEAALYPAYEGGVMLDELCARLSGLGFQLVWGFNVFAASTDLFWRNRRARG